MESPVFCLESVTVRDTARPRLEIDRRLTGRCTAVIGPSGAGKTTLLDLLVGFARPTAGKVAFTPRRPAPLPLFWAPSGGGLWPHLDVRGNLLAVLPDGTPAAEADGWLERFELVAQAGSSPGDLSLGEQSRLVLARALASGAATVVLDEPLAHVDPARLGRFWQRTIESCRQTDTTVVFATHLPEMVLSFADEVLCLDAGRVVFHGAVEDLYLRPASAELAGFLGVANWLVDEDRELWDLARAPTCLRPEHLALDTVPASPWCVVTSAHLGPTAETRLRHRPTGSERTFHHSAVGGPLRLGSAVAFRLCVALLLLVVGCLGSCGGAGPDLGFRAVAHFHLSPLGTRLPAPRGVTVTDDGRLMVLDNAGRVLVYAPDGSVEREWMMPEFDVGRPEGICQLRDGRVAVADTHYSRVVFFDGKGTVLATVGCRGTGPGQFQFPIKVIQDPSGNLYVAEYGSNDRVQKFTEDGRWLCSFGSFGTGAEQFQRPSGLVWRDGEVYVVDAVQHRIQVFSDGGDFRRTLGGPQSDLDLRMPYDLAQGPDGNLYTCEYSAGRVTCLTTQGELLGRFGKIGRGAGEMVTPWGIAVASDSRVIVADTGNRRLVEWRR